MLPHTCVAPQRHLPLPSYSPGTGPASLGTYSLGEMSSLRGKWGSDAETPRGAFPSTQPLRLCTRAPIPNPSPGFRPCIPRRTSAPAGSISHSLRPPAWAPGSLAPPSHSWRRVPIPQESPPFDQRASSTFCHFSLHARPCPGLHVTFSAKSKL